MLICHFLISWDKYFQKLATDRVEEALDHGINQDANKDRRNIAIVEINCREQTVPTALSKERPTSV